jgi:hypothetical protein
MPSWKDTVRVATTGVNIALSGTQTIDGVPLAVGNRVLVKDQTTASENGIYIVASGSWTRATDANTSALMIPQMVVRVAEGTVNGGNSGFNAGTEWVLVTNGAITLGTTDLLFVQSNLLATDRFGQLMGFQGNSTRAADVFAISNTLGDGQSNNPTAYLAASIAGYAPYATGIRGRNGSGSLQQPGAGVGVWGDSDGGCGVYGSSSNSDGVQGWGNGPFSGVAGFGGAGAGNGVLGIGGTPSGPGVRGVGAGGPTVTVTTGSVGVHGMGAEGENEGQPGVVGLGGPSNEISGPGVVGIGGLIGGIGGDPNRGPSGYGPDDPRVLNSMGVYGRGAVAAAGIYGEGGVPGGRGVIGVGAGFNLEGGLENEIPAMAGVYGQGGFPYGRGAGIGEGPPGVAGQGGVNGPGILGLGGVVDLNVGLYAPAGVFEGDVNIIAGNLNVSGAKSAVVAFPDGTQRRLYCMESPECWFEDFGTAQLINGQAQVQLDPDFASVVAADDYHVFLTEYDDNNGLYVTGRTATGFGVRAKASPNASGTFSYRVVAKRNDIVAPRFEEVPLPRRRTADRAARRQAPPASRPGPAQATR